MEFLKKYGLTSEDIEDLLKNNDEDYIRNFTDDLIENKAPILLKYDIDFIDELILCDIGIFAYTDEEFEKRIVNMIKVLGDNYLEIINDDICTVIDYIYNYEE